MFSFSYSILFNYFILVERQNFGDMFSICKNSSGGSLVAGFVSLSESSSPLTAPLSSHSLLGNKDSFTCKTSAEDFGNALSRLGGGGWESTTEWDTAEDTSDVWSLPGRYPAISDSMSPSPNSSKPN